MKTRTTIILAVILLLLAGFYYIYDVNIKGKKEKKKSEEDKVFSFEKKDVSALQLQKGKETLCFEKEAGGWKMTKPSAMTASSSVIDTFLGELQGIKKEDVVEEKPADLVPFGLKPPEMTVKVLSTTGGASSESTLNIGAKNPSGSSYYAQMPGKEAVVKIPSSISYQLEKHAADWEEKEALPIEPNKVTFLQVNCRNRLFSLENPQSVWTTFRKSSVWTLKMPDPEPGDKGKISAYLWDIKNLKAAKLLKDDQAKSVPFDSSTATMKIAVEQEGRAPETLLVGPLKEGKYLAMREGTGEKMLLNPPDVDKLMKNPDDFIEKRIVIFEAKDVAKYEVKSGDLDLLAERSKEAWKIKKPAGVKKPPATIDGLLWQLQDARYIKKIAEKAEPDALKKPEATITLWGKGDRKLYTVILATDPKVPSLCYAKVSPSSGFYYELDLMPIQKARILKDEIKIALTKPSPSPKGPAKPSVMPSGASPVLPATPSASAPASPLTTPGSTAPKPSVTNAPGTVIPAPTLKPISLPSPAPSRVGR
jgi:hypothetical protein